MRYSFRNDYSEGAHPRLLEALARTNLEQTVGYGLDGYCDAAREKIRSAIGRADLDVHFLVGGTQANTIVIAAALRPHQAVIAAQTGHVNVHETGAIEATGHKVVAMPGENGKLTPVQVQAAVDSHTDEHMVQPKLVYISQSTEIGTVYSLKELEALRSCCDRNGLLLYIDGARLACALAAQGNDVTLSDLARLSDAFSIGGTKCGALFGEAVVLRTHIIRADFRYFIKQRGGMLAKGRLLGVQFSELFEGGLYEELGAHANRMATLLRSAFAAEGIPMLTDSPTNQQFPILPNRIKTALEQNYEFEIWEARGNGTTVVRFVTSWATPEDAVRDLIGELHRLCAGNQS